MEKGKPIIRRAKISDIKKVCRIESASFAFPWSFASFLSELRNPFSLFYVLVDEKNDVLGYFVLWDLNEELHLANIAIAPHKRRRKLGSFLLKKIIEIGKKNNKKGIRLEVRVSNRPAISLYEKIGFKKIKVLPSYYINNFEDGLEYYLEL